MFEQDVATRFSIGKVPIYRIKRSQNSLENLKDNEVNVAAYLKKRKNCVLKPQYELIEDAVKFLAPAREALNASDWSHVKESG